MTELAAVAEARQRPECAFGQRAQRESHDDVTGPVRQKNNSCQHEARTYNPNYIIAASLFGQP